MIEIEKKLLLVDGHSLIHRAYHAFPATLSTASGEQTNAVYGFTRMLLEAVHELKPTHVAVAFDLPGPTFRETMFVGYKRSRVKPDDAMIVQIPRVKEVVQTLGIPIFEVAGYEADDVIGTLTKQAVGQTRSGDTLSRVARQPSDNMSASHQSSLNDRPSRSKFDHSSYGETGDQFPRKISPSRVSRDSQVIILTSDRDLMQLIQGDRVMVKMPERKKRLQATGYRLQAEDFWNEERFIEHWGFRPALLPDYKAFAGDQSDDIPGVRGIGEKTGKELVARFGEVNNVYGSLLKRKAESGKRKGSDLNASRPSVMSSGLRLRDRSDSRRSNDFTLHASLLKKLVEDQEAAQMSKKLATIDTDVPIKLDWKAMEVHGYNKEKALKLFDELQFKTLIPKLPNDSFEESVQEMLF